MESQRASSSSVVDLEGVGAKIGEARNGGMLGTREKAGPIYRRGEGHSLFFRQGIDIENRPLPQPGKGRHSTVDRKGHAHGSSPLGSRQP